MNPALATEETVHNIARLMELRAAERPDQKAVVAPSSKGWDTLSFSEINRLTDEYARGFLAMGVQRGDRVSLLIKPSIRFIPVVFAVFKLGAIPVFVDPGMGRKGFLSCIERMKPRVLIALPLVHALSPLFRRALASVEVRITDGGTTGYWGGKTLEQLRVVDNEPFEALVMGADDEAAILFTSGSTGAAKGVTYTHGIFAAQTRLIGQMYNIQPGEIELACFPLFGLFSMALGITVVIPDVDPSKPAKSDPAKLMAALQQHQCTSAMGSPAFWRNLGAWCTQHGHTLPHVQRILTFGAPIPVWMHQQFASILPDGAEIHTPYGATECLPVASIATHEVLEDTQHKTRQGAGTCVGKPHPEADVRIIGISDEPIEAWVDGLSVPVGQVGEITVMGPMVTPEYKNEPGHTRAAKIDHDGRVRHRMGDLGYVDEQGRLWFCGRKGHRVAMSDGSEVYPVQVEGVFAGVPGVARTAGVGVGGELVLCVETQPGADKEHVLVALKERAQEQVLSQRVAHWLFHPGFPVDVRHNAKIHRPELATWAAGRLA